MEPQVGYRIKLSIDNLRTSDEAFQILKKLVARQKNSPKGMKQLADAIPEGYLDGQSQMIDTVNLQEVHNSFMASSTHLFSFVMNYRYRKEVTRGEKLIFSANWRHSMPTNFALRILMKSPMKWNTLNICQMMYAEC